MREQSPVVFDDFHITQLADGTEMASSPVVSGNHDAAFRQVGVSDPVLRRQACKLGLCVPVSQLQRRINATEQGQIPDRESALI